MGPTPSMAQPLKRAARPRTATYGASMTKAPQVALRGAMGGEDTGPNPTDRAKSGAKRSLLVDENGVPLALTVGGANTPDANLLDATLAAKQTKEKVAVLGRAARKPPFEGWFRRAARSRGWAGPLSPMTLTRSKTCA